MNKDLNKFGITEATMLAMAAKSGVKYRFGDERMRCMLEYSQSLLALAASGGNAALGLTLPEIPAIGDKGYSSSSSVNRGAHQQHYSAHQMREYGEACHAVGRGAAVREYIENGTFKCAPVDPTVQGMADCMHMVQQELIEADAIPGGTAPMFIANEVVRKLNSYKRENLELKRVYDERGEQIKRLDIALERAASAPNAALVAALEALEEVGALEDGLLGDDPKTLKAQKMARAALSAAGQEVGS